MHPSGELAFRARRCAAPSARGSLSFAALPPAGCRDSRGRGRGVVWGTAGRARAPGAERRRSQGTAPCPRRLGTWSASASVFGRLPPHASAACALVPWLLSLRPLLDVLVLSVDLSVVSVMIACARDSTCYESAYYSTQDSPSAGEAAGLVLLCLRSVLTLGVIMWSLYLTHA